MRKLTKLVVPTLALAFLAVAPASAGEHRIGVGYHYFEALGDINSPGDINDSGNSIVFSYQYLPGGLLRFEGDLEYYSGGYGGSTGSAYAPQVYALLGRGFYGGLGVGFTNGDFPPTASDPSPSSWSDPWYAAKVGVDLLLLPKIHLDINANYRADAFKALDEADSDGITLGASVRLTLF